MCTRRVWRVLGSGGSVRPIRAPENTRGEVRGSRAHPGAPFPSDLLRNRNGGFLAETRRNQCVLLVRRGLHASEGNWLSENLRPFSEREYPPSTILFWPESIGVVEHPQPYPCVEGRPGGRAKGGSYTGRRVSISDDPG